MPRIARTEEALAPGPKGKGKMALIKQPEPIKEVEETPVVMMVIRDLLDRADVGLETYGTLLTAENGRSQLEDAYYEALDLACYLRAEIEWRKKLVGRLSQLSSSLGEPLDLVELWEDETRCEQD